MLTYSQTNGTVTNDSGIVIASGWSGNHNGKNNPLMQNVPCIGPLPQGLYTICAWEALHDHLGQMVAFLRPDKGNEMFGRGDFFMHGPSSTHYGQESKGCIVIPHDDRETVKYTGETDLLVVE